MTIIMVGDLRSGFRFIGPFANEEEAIKFAGRTHMGSEWWTAELCPPEDYANEVVAI